MIHPRPHMQHRKRHAIVLAAITGVTLVATTVNWSPAAGVPTATPDQKAAPAATANTLNHFNRRILDERVTEASGLAHSTWKRKTLFTHNDSGDTPRVFAVNRKGHTVGVLKLKGAEAYDWEDMAAGPNHTLLVGDIGDNARSRKQVQVYRFKEPMNLRDRAVKATKFTFAYPDGAHDAEGMMVNPRNGRIFIVSKQNNGSLYRAPKHLSTTKVNKLSKMRGAPADVTGAAFHPRGKGYALGTHSSVHMYKSLKASPRKIWIPSRERVQSIEFNRSGKRLFAGSEGNNSPIVQVAIDPDSTAENTQSSCVNAPKYSASGTKFGSSVSTSGKTLAQSVNDVDSKFGHVPVVRMFHPALPSRDDWSRRAPALGKNRTIVTSFKLAPKEVLSGAHDDEIRAYFRDAPNNPILYSYFHEPDAKIAAGMFTKADYRAAFRHVVEIAGSLCRDNLFPTLILTGWAADPSSGRDWRDYYPGDDFVSVMSWDPYNSATTKPTKYVDPTTLYAHVLRESKEIGKPWGIAETGSARVAGDEGGSQRAVWLNKVGAYFEKNGAAYVTYFQSTNTQDFELRDAQSIKAWRAWVQS